MIYVQISFLTDLDRSCYSLCSARNLCLLYVRSERHKKISFLSSLGIFKHSLLQYSQFPTRNYLCYIGDPSASTSHTRLRLNFSVLKYHLFQKNCCLSPACPLSDAPVEYPKHWFLYCPSCAALRLKTCLPPLHNYPDIDSIVLPIRKKIDWFLNGISDDDFDSNVMFCFVFFSTSNHLFPFPTVFLNFYCFLHVLFDRHV